MLRSDPKAAWQEDHESCVLMYPVYLRADRSTPPLSPALRDPAQHRHPRVAAGGQPCGIFRASLVSLSLSQSLGSRGPVLVFPRSDFEYQIGATRFLPLAIFDFSSVPHLHAQNPEKT